ncbi:MAG: DUF5110 domain-containing protein, partial [Burkholderiaceae bacterium]|nr:DUF5110 domain-containing protein [Burkholderiaceae bacterium]
LGGFAGPNLDDELYTRWLQYGVFQPIFRPHAQEEVPSEPVYRDAPTEALAKQAVLLRYRLLPYNYTLAFDNNQHGWPFMRPLFFAEPGNAKLYAAADSYMWGDAFLVSPVLKAGVTQQDIYFPAGSNWFDFYTGKAYRGGDSATVALTADHIPVFVKGGAFVPMALPMQNTDAYSTKRIELHYWHDATVSAGSGKLYDDDGKTPNAFEKGKYEELHFSSRYNSGNDGGKLVLTLASERGPKQAAMARNVELIVHQVDAKPKQVAVGGRAVPFSWNADSRTLAVTVSWKASAEQSVTIDMTD